jgi:hypothetical protein
MPRQLPSGEIARHGGEADAKVRQAGQRHSEEPKWNEREVMAQGSVSAS